VRREDLERIDYAREGWEQMCGWPDAPVIEWDEKLRGLRSFDLIAALPLVVRGVFSPGAPVALIYTGGPNPLNIGQAVVAWAGEQADGTVSAGIRVVAGPYLEPPL